MAAKDIITKEYMKDAAVFADAFNFLLFDGKPVIDPSKFMPWIQRKSGCLTGKEIPKRLYRNSVTI